VLTTAGRARTRLFVQRLAVLSVGVRRHRFIPPGHEVPKESWGYSGVEKNEQDALSRLTGLYQAIARTPAWQASAIRS